MPLKLLFCMKVDVVNFRGRGAAELAALASAEGIGFTLLEDRAIFSPARQTLAAAQRLIKKLTALAPESGLQGTFSFEAYEPFTPRPLAPLKAEIEAMQAYVDRLVEQYRITVCQISRTSCGRAWFASRKIKITKVKDVDTFCVCLHEVGHILNGPIRPVYLSEFHTEQQALRLAKLFAEEAGLTDNPTWQKGLQDYERRAKGYVIWHIAKGYKNGLRVTRLLPEAKRWLDYDFSIWPDNRVEVRRYSNNYKVTLTPA